MADRELEMNAGRRQGNEGQQDIYDDLMDAIYLASDQDSATWVTYDGKRIAKITPVNEIPDAALPPPPTQPGPGGPDFTTRLSRVLALLAADRGLNRFTAVTGDSALAREIEWLLRGEDRS
jgi:hypothetical protein